MARCLCDGSPEATCSRDEHTTAASRTHTIAGLTEGTTDYHAPKHSYLQATMSAQTVLDTEVCSLGERVPCTLHARRHGTEHLVAAHTVVRLACSTKHQARPRLPTKKMTRPSWHIGFAGKQERCRLPGTTTLGFTSSRGWQTHVPVLLGTGQRLELVGGGG